MSWQPSSRQYPDYCRRVHKASIDARARNWYLHSVFVERIMVSGIMFCFSEWRLELRLCPATTLMHSAVEKSSIRIFFGERSRRLPFGSVFSPCFGRSVDIDAVRVPCLLYTIRSVRSTSKSSNLTFPLRFPPFDFSFPLFPDALPKPDAKHPILKVCILCACY